MPTNDGSMQETQDSHEKPKSKRRGVTRALHLAFYLAVFVAADVALSFILLPFCPNSERGVFDYRKVENEVDTIYVGSSTTEQFVNPQVVDPILGSSSFNFGVGQGNLSSSFQTIKKTVETHPNTLHRVVLGASYNDLVSSEAMDPQLAMAQAWGVGESVPQRLRDLGTIAFNPDYIKTNASLTTWMPWVQLHVDLYDKSVMDNINRRMTMDTLTAAQVRNPEYYYAGRGFISYMGDSMRMNNISDGENIGSISDKMLNQFTQIADYCKKHKVQLVVVVPPCASFRLIMYGKSYPQNMSKIKAITEQYGGQYLDFNLWPDEWQHFSLMDYWDNTHLMLKAANTYSELLGQALKKFENGEDPSAGFYDYDHWDDVIAHYDMAMPVFAHTHTAPDGIHVEPYSYEGPNQHVEYEVCLRKNGLETEVIKPYSADGKTVYKPQKPGKYTFRVNIRRVGQNVPFEHYCDVSSFW